MGQNRTENPAGHEYGAAVEHEEGYAPVLIAAMKCWLEKKLDQREEGKSYKF